MNHSAVRQGLQPKWDSRESPRAILEKKEGEWSGSSRDRSRTGKAALGPAVGRRVGGKSIYYGLNHKGGRYPWRSQTVTSNKQKGNILQSLSWHREGFVEEVWRTLKVPDFIFHFQTRALLTCSNFAIYVFCFGTELSLFRGKNVSLVVFNHHWPERYFLMSLWSYPIKFQVLLSMILIAKTKPLIHCTGSEGPFWWNPRGKHYGL